MRLIKLSASILVFGLTSCASAPVTPYKIAPLTATTVEASVKTIIVQPEIEAIIPVSDSSGVGAQYGLIGMLVSSAIDAGINSSAQDQFAALMTPVKDSVIDFRFDDEFQNAVKDSIKATNWISASDFTLQKEPLESNATLSKPSLNINTTYRLRSDMRGLLVEVSLSLMPNKLSSDKNDVKPIYHNLFTYQSTLLPIPIISAEDIAAKKQEARKKYDALSKSEKQDPKNKSKLNKVLSSKSNNLSGDEQLELLSKQWSANQGELLRRELKKSIQDIALMIKMDLEDRSPTSGLLTKLPVTNNGFKHNYELVTKHEDRMIVRNVVGFFAGTLCSLPQGDSRNCN